LDARLRCRQQCALIEPAARGVWSRAMDQRPLGLALVRGTTRGTATAGRLRASCAGNGCPFLDLGVGNVMPLLVLVMVFDSG
jgi:hypothetical protein